MFAIQTDVKLLMFGGNKPDSNDTAFGSVVMPLKVQMTLKMMHYSATTY